MSLNGELLGSSKKPVPSFQASGKGALEMCVAGAEVQRASRKEGAGALAGFATRLLLRTRAFRPALLPTYQQLCRLCRLQAEGNGQTECSHFVHASIPAGSKAREGPCPSPVEAWKSLPASSSSSEGEGSPPRCCPAAGGREAGHAGGVGAPSSGARPLLPGSETRGKPVRRELFGRGGAKPPGGPVAEVSEHRVWAPPACARKDASGFRVGLLHHVPFCFWQPVRQRLSPNSLSLPPGIYLGEGC